MNKLDEILNEVQSDTFFKNNYQFISVNQFYTFIDDNYHLNFIFYVDLFAIQIIIDNNSYFINFR
jgi:hypothetical protein